MIAQLWIHQQEPIKDPDKVYKPKQLQNLVSSAFEGLSIGTPILYLSFFSCLKFSIYAKKKQDTYKKFGVQIIVYLFHVS